MAATVADQAFERLYARYGREVYRYALALLRNPVEAEDVTQTTFLNAYRALRAGARPRRPHNWLIAIAHNVCRSRARFAMRRPKEVPLDEVVEQLAAPESERPNIGELLRTMRRLPSNQRAAIAMREFEGRSYVDIAERLGVTVPAAEALIGRARRTLRERAAAFRGLLLAPSRWLRNPGEHGEAVTGAVGTAAAAKVAALLVVGAVGGGVGIAAGGSPHASSAQFAARATPAPLTAGGRAHDAAGVAARSALAAHGTTASPPGLIQSAAAVPASQASTTASAPAVTGPTVSAAAEETAAAGTTARTTVTAAVAQMTKAITTVAGRPPAVTTPSATTPPVTTPVATVPPVTVPTVTVPTVTVPPVTGPPLP
jgi:RNA polymerase sigma factor (sigma-70 family)